MKHIITALVMTVFCGLLIPPISHAQNAGRDLEKEKEVWQELEKISPPAVEKFKAATENLDQNKHEEAIKLYEEVLRLAPDFDHALRRIGYALVAVGRRAEGLEMSSKALEIRRSGANLSGYASLLANLGGDGEYQTTPSEKGEALTLLREAQRVDPEYGPDYLLMIAQLALDANNLDAFETAVRTLKEKHPDEAGTHYFNAIHLANYGAFSEAEKEVREAEKLGVPAEATAPLLAAIEEAKSQSYYGWEKYLLYGLVLVGLWAVGLVVLFVAGKILSAKTLTSVENSDPNDIDGDGQEGLKGIYRKVITVAGIYYYLSQPVIVLLVLALAGGIAFFFLYIGRIPVKLLLIVGVVALATIFYMVKSLVIRAKIEDPGRVLSEAEAPGLWSLARDVAEAVKTRPIDEIRITHGAELAVYERGSIRAKMQDKAERILIVGLAVIRDFDQNAFRAVLAHEYGHFSNRDTAGGDIAFHVNNDIMRLAESMALSGTATFYNIAFQFLRFYHFLFRRITHGASRLQEILADRMAVYQFGREPFREGLRHVIRRDLEFSLLADKEINAALASSRSMRNLYELQAEDEMTKNDLAQAYDEYFARPTTEDDTHPSPKDRFRLIEKINPKETPPLEGRVWDLFTNREALTQEMNSLLEERMRQYG
jgi:tetratricopeptide (TPR) repeat protein/Zn-dependent protease with chaperone function